MTKSVIFTIGHSTHSLEVFLDLLQAHGITHLIDVRSVPASSYNPQFNQAPLSVFLKNHDIQYLHFGKEFGARYTEAKVLDTERRVDFELIRPDITMEEQLSAAYRLHNIEVAYSPAMHENAL